MSAINFIKQHGVDKAREVVSKHAESYIPELFKYWSEQLQDYVLAPKYASFLVSDLKRLVESVDLVNCNGAWNAQQSKIDELQKENAALVHVIKSRDIQLENEKHEYDELMNKLVDGGMKNKELQKRLDAALKMISINRGFAWGSVSISRLEQALKGGDSQ